MIVSQGLWNKTRCYRYLSYCVDLSRSLPWDSIIVLPVPAHWPFLLGCLEGTSCSARSICNSLSTPQWFKLQAFRSPLTLFSPEISLPPHMDQSPHPVDFTFQISFLRSSSVLLVPLPEINLQASKALVFSLPGPPPNGYHQEPPFHSTSYLPQAQGFLCSVII